MTNLRHTMTELAACCSWSFVRVHRCRHTPVSQDASLRLCACRSASTVRHIRHHTTALSHLTHIGWLRITPFTLYFSAVTWLVKRTRSHGRKTPKRVTRITVSWEM